MMWHNERHMLTRDLQNIVVVTSQTLKNAWEHTDLDILLSVIYSDFNF